MVLERGGGLLLRRGIAGAAVHERLSLPNPAHKAWLARPRGREPTRAIVATWEVPDGPDEGRTWWPRNAPSCGAFEVVDATVFPSAPAIKLAPGFQLRDYQAEGVRCVLASRDGVIVAPCGAGKTSYAMGMIAALPTPALILVHTKDLAAQWAGRIKAQLVNCRTTQVGGGAKVDITGRVVIGTIQTLARWTWVERQAFGERFGLVILDEAHHAPAQTFAQIFGCLPARYRVGLTATPTRYDGLTDMLHWTCGPVVHQITQPELEQRGYVLRPDVWQVHTGWTSRFTDGEPHERAEDLATHDQRNALIRKLIAHLRRSGRRTLCLVDRVSHAELLAAETGGVALHADSKDRAAIVARLASGDVDAVFATSLADEALDAPPIDAVVLATPEGNLGTVQQRIGRACRPLPGKRTPIAVDLVDAWGPWLQAGKKRRKHYQGLGWSVKDWRP